MKIEKRLDALKEEIIKHEFISGERLGGEIPFHILDYPPEKEQLIRIKIEKMKEDLKKEGILIKEINIYDLCVEIISEKTDLSKIIDYERKNGSNKLLEHIRIILNQETVNTKMYKKISEEDQIIFITGIGNAWPMIRAHSILENLQIFVKIPLILFYPGEYSEKGLELFGLLDAQKHYRANRLINYKKEEK